MKLTSFNNLLAAAFVVSAAAGVAASCQQDPAGPETTPDLGETTDLVIPVSVEGSISCDDPSTPGTKVTVDPTTGVTAWETNDRIGVYISGTDANKYIEAPVVKETNSIRLSLTTGQSRSNYAIAPYSCRDDTGFATPKVVYPASYDMTGKGLTSANAWAPTPMVATNSGNELHFFHVGGLIRLHVTEIPTGTTALRVTFNGLSSPNHVAGTFTVNNPGTLTASTTYATSGGQNYIDFTNLSISNNEVYLNIPVPTINMSGLTSIQVQATGSSTITTTKAVSGWGSITHGLGKKVDVSFISVTHAAGYTGKFRNYEIPKGYLIWDTVAGKYKLSDPDDPLLPLRYYGGTIADAMNIIYHQWGATENSLQARIDGALNDSKSIINSVEVDGLLWRIPSKSEWNTIWSGTSIDSKINNTNASYSVVRVSLAEATSVGEEGYNYYSKGLNTNNGGAKTGTYGYHQVGLLLVPDYTDISFPGIIANNITFASGSTISWSNLKKLLDGGCIFIPATGYLTTTSWVNGGTDGYLWSAQYSSSTLAHRANFYNGAFEFNNTLNKSTAMLVLLCR